MNEVVSASHTLKVYGATEHHLSEESVRQVIERLLCLARLNTRGEYIFKVQKHHSTHQSPTLEFEHTGMDSVYLYRCRIGNIAGMTGIFIGVLRIPEAAFHGGITDELNAAAVKLLAQPPAPPLPVEAPAPVAPPPQPKLETRAEAKEEAPPSLPHSAAAEAAQAEVSRKTPRKKTGRSRPKGAVKRPRAEALLTDLSQLKQAVATERSAKRQTIATQVAELEALNELQREVEQLEATVRRLGAARELLNQLS